MRPQAEKGKQSRHHLKCTTMSKSLKFTIEVNGLDLSESAQMEISKALNQTLMHKLGELDLAGAKATRELTNTNGDNFIALKYLINGGMLLRLASKELTAAVRQVEAQNKIPTTAGEFNLMVMQ